MRKLVFLAALAFVSEAYGPEERNKLSAFLSTLQNDILGNEWKQLFGANKAQRQQQKAGRVAEVPVDSRPQQSESSANARRGCRSALHCTHALTRNTNACIPRADAVRVCHRVHVMDRYVCPRCVRGRS